MDDLISRQAAIDALGERPMVWTDSDYEIAQRNQYDMDKLAIETVPSAQPKIIRCRNCKHRPKFDKPEDEDDVGYLLFPDNKCPCRCEDEWYSWMPKKDWYCGNAEREK